MAFPPSPPWVERVCWGSLAISVAMLGARELFVKEAKP